MLSILLALVAAILIAIAIAGLAGHLWAVLFVGLLLGWMSYVAHLADQKTAAVAPKPKATK